MASGTPAPKLQPPDLYIHWFKENFEAVVVAYVMALFIRCFFVEVFQIPTSSMEPTLRGDTTDGDGEHGGRGRVLASGDRIMVNKFYYGLMPIRRFDVAIFRMPLNQPKVFIKRCVGLPGETWCMYKGNVYTKPPGEPHAPFKIARKDLDTMTAIWIAPHGLGDTGKSADLPPYYVDSYLQDVVVGDSVLFSVDDKNRGFKYYWTVPSNDVAPSVVMPGRLRVEKIKPSHDAEFAVRSRMTNREGNDPLDDLLLAATFSVDGAGGAMSFTIRNGYGRFLAAVSPDPKIPGELRWYDPKGAERATVKLATPTIAAGREYSLRLMVFDGRCVLTIDGKVEGEVTFIETVDDAQALWSPPEGPQAAFTSHGLPFTMTDLRLGRDVHYRPRTGGPSNIGEGPGEAIAIPEGRYLFFGDNQHGSHDGRCWRRITYVLKSGQTVVCESYDHLVQPATPIQPERIVIRADRYGDRYEFFADEIQSKTDESYMTVPRDFILGRAFWVWWPKAPGKVRLIR